MKLLLRALLVSAALLLFAVLALGLINKHVRSQVAGRMETSITEIAVEDPPRVAVVFGAGSATFGDSADDFDDRIVTAVELYRSGRVKKILISGDDPAAGNNTTQRLKSFAEKLRVPADDISIDGAARRTSDACSRARTEFDFRKAILVTQEPFLPRALYVCQGVGLDCVGITADRRRYSGVRWANTREFFAVAAAWVEMAFRPA